MADENELSRGAEERLRAEIGALRAEIRDAVGRSAVANADLAARIDVAPTPAVTSGPDVEAVAGRSPARGEPIALSQADVNQLTRGDIDLRLARRLASSPSLRTAQPERDFRGAVFGPVKVEPRDLEIVAATGKTTESLTAALDAAARTPGRFGQIHSPDDSEKARPEFTPEDR